MSFQKNIVKQIIIIIEEGDIHSCLDINEISRLSGYSKWHLQRCFYKHMKIKIGTYIRRRRLVRAACQLIETNLKISDISTLAGFSSQQAMSRAFITNFKKTPASFRTNKDWVFLYNYMDMCYDDSFNETIEKWLHESPGIKNPYPTILTDSNLGYPIRKERGVFFF